MKRFLFLLLLFSFSCFADYTVTRTVFCEQYEGTPFNLTIASLPCRISCVSSPGSSSVTSYPSGIQCHSGNDPLEVTSAQDWLLGAELFAYTHEPSGASVTVTIVYSGDNPNPEEPDDPDDPDNPDDPDDPGGGSGDYALETTLQSTNYILESIASRLLSILGDTALITPTLLDLHDDLTAISTSLSSVVSSLSSINSSLTTISSDLATVRTDVHTMKSDISDIKSALSGGSTPTRPTRITQQDIPSSVPAIDTIKRKIFPPSRLFNDNSKTQYSVTFNFDYEHAPEVSFWQSYALPITGSGNVPIGDPLIQQYNSFITFFRSVFLVLVMWCFVKVVIKTLRQW